MTRRLALLSALLLGCSPDVTDQAEVLPPVEVAPDMAEAPADAGTPKDGGSYWPDLMCIESKEACGRCGEREIVCVAGIPTPGACMGEHGECDAGQVAESADKCSTRTCKASCVWTPFSFKPGSQCGAGETRSCVPNPATCNKSTGVQECSGCKWTACLCK